MTAPFISSDDLAAYVKADSLGLDSSLTVIALDAACSAVRAYVEQNVESSTETDAYFDGNGQTSLVLPHFPVTTMTALSVYDDRTDTAPEVLVENTDYVLNYATGVLSRIDGYTFVAGRQNIKATYSYGNATVPADIRMVALQVASRIYEIGMVENESMGGVSATYVKGAGQLTVSEKDALRRYRA